MKYCKVHTAQESQGLNTADGQEVEGGGRRAEGKLLPARHRPPPGTGRSDPLEPIDEYNALCASRPASLVT